MVVLSLTGVFSGRAQFTVTLSAEQDLPYDPPPVLNGYPLNFIYTYSISGSFPPPVNSFDSVVAISVGLGAIDSCFTTFSASNVGGQFVNNPPPEPGDQIDFVDDYNGGLVDGTLTVGSAYPMPDNLTWEVGELAYDDDGSGLSLVWLGGYQGVVAVPEPMNTGLVLGVMITALVGFPVLAGRLSRVP